MGAMSAHEQGPRGVLVVGDANPDLVLTGDVIPRFGQQEQLLDGARLTIGGSAAITAHGLARLGRPVRLLAAVGEDDVGHGLARDLDRAGVDLSGLRWRSDVPTGLTVVLALPHDRAILTHPGAIPTLSADEVRRAVADAQVHPAGLRHVHVASLFLQPALVRDLADLLAELRAQGVTTSVDTGDDPAGRWSGVDGLLPHLDVFLPNRAEVVALGDDPDPERAATRLAGHGPLVVVKAGDVGAFAATAGGDVLRHPAAVVDAVDTTGAGDTFDAAFLDGWLDGRPLAECLARATRAGAMAVQALGGVSGQPARNDLTETSVRDAVRHES